jgi:riboflavin kinase/FMN adenylyltransferase
MNFVRDIIVNQINTHKLVIGYNHHFGRNREGSFEHLKEFSPLYGFEVEEIPAQLLDEVSVSSTKIRKALLAGDVSKAFNYLGYHYQLEGTVVKGKEIGRTIDFPTANLGNIDNTKLIPKDGVYAVKISHDGKEFDGMMNIGKNPTLGINERSLEVHIFNFDGNLYGVRLKVNFVERLREEMTFEDVDSLKKQLLLDKQHAIQELK